MDFIPFFQDIYEDADPAPVLENPNLLFSKVVKAEPGVSGLGDLVQAEDDSSLSSLFRCIIHNNIPWQSLS